MKPHANGEEEGCRVEELEGAMRETQPAGVRLGPPRRPPAPPGTAESPPPAPEWRPARGFQRPAPAATQRLPDVMTLEEAAAHMGRSPEQVRRLLKRGLLPGTRSGKSWRISGSELQAFLQSDDG